MSDFLARRENEGRIRHLAEENVWYLKHIQELNQYIDHLAARRTGDPWWTVWINRQEVWQCRYCKNTSRRDGPWPVHEENCSWKKAQTYVDSRKLINND